MKDKLNPNHMVMEFLKWAGRKTRGAALATRIGSISFSGTDHRSFRRPSRSFGSFNDAGNQLSMELQRRHDAQEQDFEAAVAMTVEAAVELQPPPSHAPITDLDAAAAAAEDRAVSNSSGGEGGDGRAGKGSGPTAAAEEASNASKSKTIGELALPMLACMGIYSTIYADEQLQHLHPSLYFSLLTLLVSGAYASLYSIFYDLAGEGRGGAEEARELVKRKWLKVALTCTGLALSLRVALGFY